MFTFLTIIFFIVLYIVGAGITYGYGKHRWPKKMVSVRRYYTDVQEDENSPTRVVASIFWPSYWVFIWPFTFANEITFSNIEKQAGHRVAANKLRIADLRATKEQLAASNAELEEAEASLDKEIAKGL